MPQLQCVLTDTKHGIYQDPFHRNGHFNDDSGATRHWSVQKQTLKGGVSDGVDVVTIDNGDLQVRVLPTRGMGIWTATLRDLPVGWNSPIEMPVHPSFVSLESNNGLGWLGGFNELVARCGLASNGPPGNDPNGNPLENPLTLHGRIANIPAHRVLLDVNDDSEGSISLTGTVDERSLFGTNLRLTSTLTTRFGSNEIVIKDTITNCGSKPADSQLLYHINVGPPILDEGARFIIPAKQVAPRDPAAAKGTTKWSTCGPPVPGFAEEAYFIEPVVNDRGESMALLRNHAGNHGLSVHFSTQELPCLTIWKNTAATQDGYVIGIEPATNFPNPRNFEREHNRVLQLEAGESRSMTVRLAFHDRLEQIALMESHAERLIAANSPIIHSQPHPDWSPT